jgi:hypothetical protein
MTGGRLIGTGEPDPPEDPELVRLDYVQPDLSGGTMVADRSPHPNSAMEAKFREAESVGFRIEQQATPEWGRYYRFEDECEPPHLGTVNEADVYAVQVERILRRCPKWKAWKKAQEGEVGP